MDKKTYLSREIAGLNSACYNGYWGVVDPVPNVPLLRKATEWVAEQSALSILDPNRKWDQTTWYETRPETGCGTVCCVAGYVSVDLLGNDPGNNHAEKTSEALGLTFGEAETLFKATNTAETVQLVAELIAERAGEKL